MWSSCMSPQDSVRSGDRITVSTWEGEVVEGGYAIFQSISYRSGGHLEIA